MCLRLQYAWDDRDLGLCLHFQHQCNTQLCKSLKCWNTYIIFIFNTIFNYLYSYNSVDFEEDVESLKKCLKPPCNCKLLSILNREPNFLSNLCLGLNFKLAIVIGIWQSKLALMCKLSRVCPSAWRKHVAKAQSSTRATTMSSHMPRRQVNLETDGKLYIRLTSNKYPICSQYSGTEDFGNISQLEVGSVQSETTKVTKGKLFSKRICNAKHVVEQKSNIECRLTIGKKK